MLTKTTLYKKELMNAICDDDVFSHFFACLPASNDECFVSSLLHHILQTPNYSISIFFNFYDVVIVWNLQQKPKNIVF